MYRDWRGRFYPRDVPQRRWLEYYAQHFNTVELNATTYRLPKESQVQQWCAAVPRQFVYTVKLSRLITHRRALPQRVDEFIENYMQRTRCFTPKKVSQILVQFPPFLERDDDHLRTFLDKLPTEFRYVVEFRHQSWYASDVETILRDRNMAQCIHDYPGLLVPDTVTTRAFAYIRLHGYEGLYVGRYPKRVLKQWATKICMLAQEASDVYVYFNNDVCAAAPHDARTLTLLI